eukprot:6391341-Pyramimonas_sp.AAC.1
MPPNMAVDAPPPPYSATRTATVQMSDDGLQTHATYNRYVGFFGSVIHRCSNCSVPRSPSWAASASRSSMRGTARRTARRRRSFDTKAHG